MQHNPSANQLTTAIILPRQHQQEEKQQQEEQQQQQPDTQLCRLKTIPNATVT
jgi:hypothetical protein